MDSSGYPTESMAAGAFTDNSVKIPVNAKEDIKVTTLPNGLRVVSSDDGGMLSSVGVFVEAGSRYEHEDTPGVFDFLESMAFKSSENRTDFRLIREMGKVGATIQAQTSREQMMYVADVGRDNVGAVLGTFADVIQYPAFKSYEVNDAKKAYAEKATARAQDPQAMVAEGIHEAAYHNNTLGRPQHGPASVVEQYSPEALKEYMKGYYTPGRMVIAGCGVNHADLCAMTSDVFDQLPKDVASPEGPTTQPAKYTGGESRMHIKGDEHNATMCLAFETASWNSKDLVPMCVLQMMMGGGGSFSAGGPGKGMCSRLYENVLNSYGWVEQAECVNYVYSDSALFGINGMCHPAHLGELTNVIVDTMKAMAGPISAEELSRAKNQLKSTLLMQLESRTVKMEDMGRQMLTFGKVTSAKELAAQIDAVTAEDLQRVAQAMLKTKPSLSAHGDLTNLPRYDEIAARF